VIILPGYQMEPHIKKDFSHARKRFHVQSSDFLHRKKHVTFLYPKNSMRDNYHLP
jgi:hypothetical protein